MLIDAVNFDNRSSNHLHGAPSNVHFVNQYKRNVSVCNKNVLYSKPELNEEKQRKKLKDISQEYSVVLVCK